jgi:hypothetical protein
VRGVLLLFAGVELAIVARDMSTKALGLIAAGTVAKAPQTGGVERSNDAEQRTSLARGGYTAQQGGHHCWTGEGHELELRSSRLSRCGNGGDENWIDRWRITKNGAHV